MKSLRTLPVLLACGASSLLAQTVTPSNEVVTLPSFTVSADQPNQYRAVDSSSASRIRTSIQDTAGSISVLTPEFLAEIGPARLYDATRYVAGISEGRGDGFADRQIIRGFENLNRTVDNFASQQGENADPLFIDRVEVLKGPSAIIAPTGAPGGVVTITSKTPQYKDARSLSLVLGQIDAQRVDLDLTGAFAPNSKWAYRVLAGYQNGELAADGTKDKRKLLGGSVSYQFSPATKLTVRGSYEDRWVFVYLPVFIDSSVVNGGDAVLARGFNYGNTRNGTEDWAHRGGKYGTVDALFTTSFNEHISARLAAKWQYNLQRDMFMAAVTPGLGNRYNPTTGQQTPDQTWALDTATGTYVATNSPLFDITNIQRRPFLPEGHTEVKSYQGDVAAAYRLGGVGTTTIAGFAYDDADSFSRQLIGPSLAFNLLAPVYGAQPVFNSVASKAESTAKTSQLYVNEQLSLLNDRLLLTGGLVRVATEQRNRNIVSNTTTLLDDSKNVALYGAVFKATKDISLYASRSVNAVPTIANNQPLWQEGKQWEFGAKAALLENRLFMTLARFQISQTNVTVPNPAFQSDPTQPQSLISDLKNNGWELEAMGGLTKNLSVIANYTYLHERDSLGREVRAISPRNWAMFLNYKFTSDELKGLSLFVGTTYTGRRAGEAVGTNFTPLGKVTQISFYLPEVQLWSCGGRYAWRDYTFALNVDNAFDKEYIMIPTARTNAGLGLPRNVRVTATYKF